MALSDDTNDFFKDVHWLMDILQNIDVGLVVLDHNYKVVVWNSFMQNHGGKRPEDVLDKTIFKTFPELSEEWFRHKAESVFVLKNPTFTTWEQRPYLFHFPHYRPITGTAKHMYQNSTIIPLPDTRGEVLHICLILYDVTDTATSKLAQIETNKRLEELSRIDQLTALYNRGYWEQRLNHEYKVSLRYDIPCTLVFFDIDHFKVVNDTYGHSVGDDVIRYVSEEVREQLRDTDIAGRYGGEEFGIILTNTDRTGGFEFAERLRKTIEAATVVSDSQSVQFTISIGVCEMNSDLKSHQEWLIKVDEALYFCKENGRNCTHIASF